MNKIKSFQVDHTKIKKGMYISRIDDDIVTYDLRMVEPNHPPYLENDGIHSFEHLLATYLRNSQFSDHIVYVGPMGCRTGFYILIRSLSNRDALNITKDALKYISTFEGELPGNSEVECGNYLDHDIKKAKKYASGILNILENWSASDLEY